ncbi:hypothetical protein FALBO_8423 [Fusarium albosuccineum]|uniref:Uncharacterized protein n=1 Tax=Fusarium albosuccineum TaxID=1237068 RepID=A0A8H4L9I8_9HYPO|nr:hypothetical protein FALBO_8423 [Fusarium albosuccineum]
MKQQQQQPPQQPAEPAPKKRALAGSRQEAEDQIAHWQNEAEICYEKLHYEKMLRQQQLFEEACDKVAEWTEARDSRPEIPDTKVEVASKVERILAARAAARVAEEEEAPAAETPVAAEE